MAAPQRIFALHRGDRRYRVGAAQRGGRHFAQAQRTQLAFGLQARHLAHRFLDRHGFVPAVQVVQVDHVGAQPLQAGLDIAANGFGPAVDHPLKRPARPDRLAGHAALAAQRDALAVRLQHPAYQRLIGAEAVQRRGVEQRDARIQRLQQQPLGIGHRRRRAVGVAQVHAAQPDGRDVERADAALRQAHASPSSDGYVGRSPEGMAGRPGSGPALGPPTLVDTMRISPRRSAAAPAGAAPGSRAAPGPGCCWAGALRGWRRRTRGPAARCRSC